MEEHKLLTLKELCNLLHLKPGSVYALVHYKRIPFIKLSDKCLRFRLSDIESWLSSKTVQPMQSQPVQGPKRPRGRPPKKPTLRP